MLLLVGTIANVAAGREYRLQVAIIDNVGAGWEYR
jgi:hypothetical protein